MAFIDEYNENITARADEKPELKSIRVDVPEYVYDIIADVAEAEDTHKTNALIRLVRSGDFLRFLANNDAELIVRDSDGEETIIDGLQ